MKREREMGKRGGEKKERERERERERGGGGKGRVMYTFCALFVTMFPENGGGEFRGDKFRYGNSRNTYKNNTNTTRKQSRSGATPEEIGIEKSIERISGIRTIQNGGRGIN